jgi:hypothetical protein
MIPISRWRESFARISLALAMILSLLFIVLSAWTAISMYQAACQNAGGAIAIFISPVALCVFFPLVLVAATWLWDSSVARRPMGRFSIGSALLLYVLIAGFFVACRILRVNIAFSW